MPVVSAVFLGAVFSAVGGRVVGGSTGRVVGGSTGSAGGGGGIVKIFIKMLEPKEVRIVVHKLEQ